MQTFDWDAPVFVWQNKPISAVECQSVTPRQEPAVSKHRRRLNIARRPERCFSFLFVSSDGHINPTIEFSSRCQRTMSAEIRARRHLHSVVLGFEAKISFSVPAGGPS